MIVGSKNDLPLVEPGLEILKQNGIKYEVKVLSAHRNPEELREYVKNCPAKVFICAAGLSAALPGVVASLTNKPVIGVPLSVGPLNGIDALLSIVQMPSGVPVATVGIGNIKNAAHLAIRILKINENS